MQSCGTNWEAAISMVKVRGPTLLGELYLYQLASIGYYCAGVSAALDFFPAERNVEPISMWGSKVLDGFGTWFWHMVAFLSSCLRVGVVLLSPTEGFIV